MLNGLRACVAMTGFTAAAVLTVGGAVGGGAAWNASSVAAAPALVADVPAGAGSRPGYDTGWD